MGAMKIEIIRKPAGKPLREWDKRWVARIEASPEKVELVGKHIVWCGGDHYHVVEDLRGLKTYEREHVRVIPLDPAAVAAALAGVPAVEPEGETIPASAMAEGDVAEIVDSKMPERIGRVVLNKSTRLVFLGDPQLPDGSQPSCAVVRILRNPVLTAEE